METLEIDDPSDLLPDIEEIIKEVEAMTKKVEEQLQTELSSKRLSLKKGRFYQDSQGNIVEILDVLRDDKFIGINNSTGCIHGFNELGECDNYMNSSLVTEIDVKVSQFLVVWEEERSNMVMCKLVPLRGMVPTVIANVEGRKGNVILVKEISQKYCRDTPNDEF